MEETKAAPPSAELRSIESQYRRGVAVIAIRPKLVSAGFVAWGMLDVFLLAFFFLSTVLYLVSGSFADVRLMATLDNNIKSAHAVTSSRAPAPLLVGNTTVLQRSEATDALVSITNQNTDWYATFLLRSSAAGEAESTLAFINPGEERVFAMYNLNDFSARDRLFVSDITWVRLDRHEIGDPSDWLSARNNIAIDDIRYSRDLTVGNAPVSRVTFNVQNRTGFSYWQPTFVVRVMRGSTTVAVNEVVVPQLVSGESRQVEVRFFGTLPDTATAIVEPAIFYFSPESYSGIPGGVSSPDVLQTL